MPSSVLDNARGLGTQSQSNGGDGLLHWTVTRQGHLRVLKAVMREAQATPSLGWGWLRGCGSPEEEPDTA